MHFILRGFSHTTTTFCTSTTDGEDLEEEIYMKQPPGFIQKENEDHVLRLLKPLYGLKQARRSWNWKLHKLLIDLGFKQLESDHSVYLHYDTSGKVIMAIHVDDIMMLCNNLRSLRSAKNNIKSVLNVKDLGKLKWHLGMEFTRDRKARTITLSQNKYICSVGEHFGMNDANMAPTPLDNCQVLSKADSPTPDDAETLKMMAAIPYQEAISSLLYKAICTRPDIAFAMQTLSQLSSNPGPKHWTAVKHVIQYLKGTKDFSLTLSGSDLDTTQLIRWCDVDWACDLDDRKSITSFTFFLGVGAVCYSLKKQTSVALSTAEAEYMGAGAATREALWLRAILQELGYPQKGPTIINNDNQVSILISKDPAHHSQSKHIDICHHFIHECVTRGDVILEWVASKDETADIFTKPLPFDLHTHHTTSLGLYRH